MSTLQKEKIEYQKKTLGDVIDFIDGDRGANYPSQGEYFSNGECLFLNTKNVPDTKFSFEENLFITAGKDAVLHKGKLQRGDYVLTTRGTVGNFAYYDQNIPYENVRINSGMVILRNKSGALDEKYFRYYLSSPSFIGQVKSRVSGSAQPQLPIRDMVSMEISLPGLPTQSHIASVLSAYDDLIENNEKRIKALEEMAQLLYVEWFVKFKFPGHAKVKMVDSGTKYGEIPNGWEVNRLGDVCTRIQAGGTPLRSNTTYWQSGAINWYTTAELQDGFLFDSFQRITETAILETSAKIFNKGTILMAIYGSPTVGRLGRVSGRCSCNQAAIGVTPNNDLVGENYIWYALKSLRVFFNTIATGAAQQNISKERVVDAKIVVAPKNIISNFELKAKDIWIEIGVLSKQNIILQKTRDLLIPQLVTGRRELK